MLDEHEEDDIEGDKILTADEFKRKALDKLEVLIANIGRSSKI